MCQLFFSSTQRVLLYLQIAQGIDESPVGVSHASDGVYHARAELGVGKRQVLLGDLNLSPRVVDLAIAQERLRVREGKIGLELPVDGRKDDVSLGLRVVKGDLVLTAALWREPKEIRTPRTALGRNRSFRPAESRAADREHFVEEETIECQFRIVESLGPPQIGLGRAHHRAAQLDVFVVKQGQLHYFLQAHVLLPVELDANQRELGVGSGISLVIWSH